MNEKENSTPGSIVGGAMNSMPGSIADEKEKIIRETIEVPEEFKLYIEEAKKRIQLGTERQMGATVPDRKRSLERLEKFRYIMDDPEYQKLKNIKRHGTTDTFKHSIRVAMIAADLAEKMGEDPDAAMRAGLLHDFCLLDYNLKGKAKKEAKQEANAGLFCFYHPKKAAENAARFEITQREKEAIATHMFPLGPLPKSRLGWIIRIADWEAGTEEVAFGKRKK